MHGDGDATAAAAADTTCVNHPAYLPILFCSGSDSNNNTLCAMVVNSEPTLTFPNDTKRKKYSFLV